MGRSASALAIGVLLASLVPGPLWSVQQQLSLRTVADSTTPQPSMGPGNFRLISNLPGVEISSRQVSFVAGPTTGLGSSGAGLYTEVAGALEIIANETTPVPGGVGNFSFAIRPSSTSDGVVFGGVDSTGNNGIYLARGGALEIVADRNTSLPQGGVGFGGFSGLRADGNRIAFEGGTAGGNGVYLWESGQLGLVADATTPVSGSSFRVQSVTRLDVDQTGVVFHGFRSGDFAPGIYRHTPSTGLVVLADTSTPVPGAATSFTFIERCVSTSSATVSFVGRYIDAGHPRIGVFLWESGVIRRLVDDSDVVQSTGERFLSFSGMELAGDALAVSARSDQTVGVYVMPLASPELAVRVAGIGDLVNGRAIQTFDYAFDGENVALQLVAEGPAGVLGGVYVAEGVAALVIPSLSPWGMVMLSLLLLAAALRVLKAR